MAAVCSIPSHRRTLDAGIEEAGRKIAADRTQHHPRSTRSGESAQASQSLVGDSTRNLCVDGDKALQQGGRDFGPDLVIRAADNNQPIWGDPGRPGHRRAKPPPPVEHCNRLSGGGCSHQRDPDRGQATSGGSDEANHPARGNGQADVARLRRAWCSPPIDFTGVNCGCKWVSQGTPHPNRTYVRLRSGSSSTETAEAGPRKGPLLTDDQRPIAIGSSP